MSGIGSRESGQKETVWTYLERACWKGDYNRVQEVFNKLLRVQTPEQIRFEVNLARGPERCSFLSKCCMGPAGSTAVLFHLSAHKADFNFRDRFGFTPLHHAAFNGHSDLITQLLSLGAEMRSDNEEGSLPIHCAAVNGHREIIEKLLASGKTPVNAQDAAGQTAVHKVCKAGHLDLLKIFHTHGYSLELADAEGMTPLHFAAHAGRLPVMTYLLENGAPANVRDTREERGGGMIPIHLAAMQGHRLCVIELLKHGSLVDLPCTFAGFTPLHLAVHNNHLTTIRLLVDEGAELGDLYMKGAEINPDPTDENQKADAFGFLLPPGSPTNAPDKSALKVETRRVAKWNRMIKDWPKYSKKHMSKIKERVRKGIPNPSRGEAWRLLTKSDEARDQHEPGFFEETWKTQSSKYIKQIDLDVNRTARNHIYFRQRYGKTQRSLFNVLKAYSVYNESVGYCQGMSGVAATLLMYVNEEDCFWIMERLLQHYGMMGLYLNGFPQLQENFFILNALLRTHLPSLFRHLQEEEVRCSMYSTKWFMMIFGSSLPFPLMIRLWDLIFLEGFAFVFAICLAIFKYFQKELKNASFEEIMEWVHNLDRRTDINTQKFIDLAVSFHRIVGDQKIAQLRIQFQQSALNPNEFFSG